MIIGIDPGNGLYKAVWENDRFAIPAVFTRGYVPWDTFFGENVPRSVEERYYLKMDGESFGFGKEAIERGETRKLSQGVGDQQIPEPLLAYTLALAVRGVESARVSLAIPFHYLVPKERILAISEDLTGKTLEFDLVDRYRKMEAHLRITIDRVIPSRQGIAILWDEVVKKVDFSGAVLDPDILEANVVVVDIGTGTTEFVTISNNRIVTELCSSLNIGLYNIAFRLKNYALQTYGRNLSVAEIEQKVLMEGKLFFEKTGLDLREAFQEYKKKIWEEITSHAVSVLSSMRTSSERKQILLFAGGGSKVFTPEIRRFALEIPAEVRILPDPIFANASGARKIAVYKEYKERQVIGKKVAETV